MKEVHQQNTGIEITAASRINMSQFRGLLTLNGFYPLLPFDQQTERFGVLEITLIPILSERSMSIVIVLLFPAKK